MIVELPGPPHLVGTVADYTNMVEHLEPLLVATNGGTVLVPCDLDGCDGEADLVAVGGAVVCAEHAG